MSCFLSFNWTILIKIKTDSFRSNELMDLTELQQFSEDEGWKGLDEDDLYTDKEMEKRERMLQEEMESMNEESRRFMEKDSKSEHQSGITGIQSE